MRCAISEQLSELGRHDEALSVARRTVNLFEQLAESNPHRYNSSLAHALNDLERRYSRLGRHDDALPPTQRAVEIRERLARINPDRYEPDLARVLKALGTRLLAPGRSAEAVPAVSNPSAFTNESPDDNRPGFKPNTSA